MDARSWDHVWTVFHRLLERPAGERAVGLDALDVPPEMRHEVAELLAAAQESDGFLESRRDLEDLLLEEAPADAEVGDAIGPYRIVRRIGEGGMGVVYEARQEGALERRVALKLVRRGMETREIVARFEAERRTLAVMEHPGIARVFDAGVTEAGRPFFIMEYVEGTPIDGYAAARRLPVAARLALFVAVCDAVQHAHRKGVVHRDLKPGNVLVTEEGTPKVIDFGVAKAVDRRPGATAHGQLLGTPEYMSPEQAALDPDVDTRTDVYSLGILLYELLTGLLPYGADGLRAAPRPAPPLASARAQEGEGRRSPTSPGTSRAGHPRPAGTGAGHFNRSRLGRALRGDLDWILAKALAVDREERYGTVAELAADVRRHLAGEPVLAGPPSRLYRLRKFVRRHAAGVAAAAVALAVVLAAAALLALQSHRLSRALDREAGERARAERVTAFLVDLFQSQDPTVARGRELSGREILDRAIARMPERLDDQPRVKASLLATTGRVAYQLGEYETARRLQEEALALWRGDAAGEEGAREDHDRAQVAATLEELAETLNASGDLDGAASDLTEALAIRRASPEPDPRAAAAAVLLAGVVAQARGALDEARERYVEALAGAEQAGDEALAAEVHNRRASLAVERRDLPTAEREVRLALALQERSLGRDHPRLTATRSVLGHVLHRAGRYAEGEAVYRENLAVQERVFGPDHPAVAGTLNGLGALLVDAGDLDAADEALGRAEAIWRGLGEEGRAKLSATLANRALIRQDRGLYEEAEALHREALAIDTAVYGPESPKVGADLNNLGWLYSDMGALDRAEDAYRRALALHRALFGADHPSAAFQLDGLARLHERRGALEAAEAEAREALALREAALAPDHPLVAGSQTTLGLVLTARGRPAEAEPFLRTALATRRARLAPGDWHTADTESALGECLAAAGRPAEAAPLLQTAYDALLAARGPDDLRTRRAERALARLSPPPPAPAPGRATPSPPSTTG